MIKTIIFDIGNVLADFTWKEFFEAKGYKGEMLDRIAKATVGNEKWNEYDRGTISDEEIIQSFVESDPEIKDDIVKCLTNVKGIVTRNDYAIPWIQELKQKGYQVLYLSNFSRKAERECAEALDFLPYLDGGILSYQEQVIKPMPEIYRILIDRYHLVPEECVFLDDLERNLKGAEAFGIHTIQFVNQKQAIEELKKLGVE
ncbi:MAG: HAD family phosphatase [Lachnospiraceae bacterium]|nr:HAD family phosphatase [Lachnospiraceae bacterium]